MERIDTLYTDFPLYGSRRMTVELKRLGYRVNRKRIRSLTAKMGLEAIYPKPNTSQSHPEHKVYPYLLKDIKIKQPNQIWSTDITYVRLAQGFARIAWRLRYNRGGLRFLTPTKVASLTIGNLPGAWRTPGWISRDGSAWTAADEPWTMCLSLDYGGASNMKTSMSKAMRR